MEIQRLSEEVIDQIAAGEVVERPASVVKELLENALDAGAKSIQVEVKGGGTERIMVSDDGHGIRSGEIQLAFSRHATSKLRATTDLTQINTLGFRGEALATIAAVSHLNAITRHHDDSLGTRVFLEGGRWRQQQLEPAPLGSIFIVENLFFNTPARLKFLKHPNTEKRQLARVVSRYAFIFPKVRFSFVLNGKVRFHTSGNGNHFDTLGHLLGHSHTQNMISLPDPVREGIPAIRNSIEVSGYISSPELHRADRNHIAIYVNGRWIQDSRLMYAINRAYEDTLDSGRFPYAYLDIRIPLDQVDVNVHPTKSEVRFQQPDRVFAAILNSVQNTLHHSSEERDPASISISQRYLSASKGRWFDEKELSDTDFFPTTRKRGDEDKYLVEERSLPPRTLPPLRVIGQIAAQFIVAEGPAGIYLIDQHAAHHRLIYEQMKNEHNASEIEPQPLNETYTQNLSESSADSLHQILERLKPLGVHVESFGPNSFAIRALPRQCLQLHCELDLLLPALAAANTAEDQNLLIVLSEQAAYRDGQLLTLEQQQQLTRSLERCPNPLESPLGSPTLIHITREQLAREFRR